MTAKTPSPSGFGCMEPVSLARLNELLLVLAEDARILTPSLHGLIRDYQITLDEYVRLSEAHQDILLGFARAPAELQQAVLGAARKELSPEKDGQSACA